MLHTAGGSDEYNLVLSGRSTVKFILEEVRDRHGGSEELGKYVLNLNGNKIS